MTIRVGINGFGRIGRTVFRISPTAATSKSSSSTICSTTTTSPIS